MYKIISVNHQDAVKECATYLDQGKIVCAPTDTIYGLLADATNKEAVEYLYEIRRPSNRPFIVLLPDAEWIYTFNPLIKPKHLKIFSLGVTLVVYPKTFFPSYLTRNKRSLAFRVPPKGTFISAVLEYLKKPVVAPSANVEGFPPAKSVQEAINYFGEKVDLYIDGEIIEGKASTIFKLVSFRCLKLLRAGNVEPTKVLEEFKKSLTA